MSERGPRGFERSRGTEGPREQLLSDVEYSVNRARWETGGLSIEQREILRKVDEKIQLKRDIGAITRYKDDITIKQPLKQLGIFMVQHRDSRISYTDESTGLEIRQGDPVVELHIPPVQSEDRTLSAATASLRQVAAYMDYHNLNPKYVLGVTYERLASASRRQGFTVVETSLPANVTQRVEDVYSRFTDQGKNGKPMGKVMLCYQTGEDFKARYLPQ